MKEKLPQPLSVIQLAGITAVVYGVSVFIGRFNLRLASFALVALSIVFASFVFVFASRTRKYTRDDYLLVLGYGGLAVAILDFFNLLTMPGRGVFASSGINVSTQFWLADRYVHAYTFLIAPFAAKKRFRAGFVLPAYLFATAVIILSILVFKTFPVCYVQGSGFTPLRIYAEYVICVILLFSGWFTWACRREVGEGIYSTVLFCIGLLIVGEVVATLGGEKVGDVFLFSYVCKAMAMYFIFHSTVVEGINRPFKAIQGAREKLRERLSFESLFNDLSTDLSIGTSPEEVLPVVHDGLHKLSDFTGAHRLIFLAVEGDNVQVTAAVCRKRFRSPDDRKLPVFCEWLGTYVKPGKSFLCDDLSRQIPVEARAARRFCENESLGRCAYVSCSIHDEKSAALCLLNQDSKITWDEALLSRLRLVGQLFANALQRVEAYQKTLRLRDELNHVSRITTMGQLTAALAHEIKQPLTAILSNAQVGKRYLAMTPPDLSEVNDILADIANDNRRATAIIDNIRRMIKKEENVREPVLLSDLANRLTGMLGKTISGVDIKLETALEEHRNEPVVSADTTQIQQVMVNLIMNGVDAMETLPADRKRLTIRVVPVDNGKAMEVYVKDLGTGIPEDKLGTVFDPLVTTKKDGLGMGLAISRGIVEDHNGRLWIQSTSSSGTVMAFSIPVLPLDITYEPLVCKK